MGEAGPLTVALTQNQIMRAGKPSIDLARPEEAAAIVSLYAMCVPASVWGRLGEVSELYFRRFCAGPHEVAVTAWLDGALVGACLGTGRPDTYGRRFYIENARALAGALAREAWRRPSVLTALARRAARGVVGRLGAEVASVRGHSPRTHRLRPDLPLDAPGTCYMSDFFVSQSARGRQLGTAMLRRFTREMADRGFDWCRVNTSVDNVAAQTALRRAGFEPAVRRGQNLTFVRRIGAGSR